MGPRRDSEKWPARDRRKDPDKLDLIHFELLSPYVVGRIENAIKILNELIEKTPKTQDYINYKGINIHRLLLKTARKYYEMALRVYIGQEIVKRIGEISNYSSMNEIRKSSQFNDNEGTGKWVEICGLFSPVSKIDELFDAVKSGSIPSLAELNNTFRDIYNNYDKYSWKWCANLISRQLMVEIDTISIESLSGFLLIGKRMLSSLII